MRRSIFLLFAAVLALGGPLFSQAPNLAQPIQIQPQGADTTPRYQAIYSQATATSGALTVQQLVATSATKTVVFENAWVACGAGGTFTISQNGAAATSTTLAPVALNNSPPATATAWKASNAATFAYTSAAYPVSSTQATSVDLSRFYLSQNGGTGQNLTLTAACTSGTIALTIQWIER